MLAIAFDRLSFRLGLCVTLLVLGPLALVLTIASRRHYDYALGMRRVEAERKGRILETTLRHQMMERDTTLITSILEKIGSEPDVRNVMILDHDGVVRMAGKPESVGQVMSRDSPTCLVCHAKAPADRDSSVLIDDGGEQALRSVLPIENRAECHTCHDPERALNGILIMDVSMADVEERLSRDTAWATAGAAALAALLLAGMGFLVRQLIFVRLRRLGTTARAVATGRLEERASEKGGDMISSLAGDFNHMADSLARLIGEVREQEAQLVGVMNGLEDGLVVFDKDLRVVAANVSLCRRMHLDAEALRGRQCGDTPGPTLPCCSGDGECPARLCLQTGEVQRTVFNVARRNGEIGEVEEVYASPVCDDKGKVVRVVELWRDISKRVREEEHLAEIERLVSLGALASGFSHEVNTPLASMLTCAESVLGQIDATEGERAATEVLPVLRRNAEIIRREVLRCRKITEQFLRFSRGIPPSIEPIDLRQAIENVVALTAPTAREAGATIRLELEDAGPIPVVRANTEVVQHVLLNLLVNAIQSFEGDGERTITVRSSVGADVRLQIEDTGCGIAPDAKRNLFEPFRSRKRQGTGLGLFLSRSFMRRFDGDVRLLRSEVGAGSCFEVIFPRAVGDGS